jgi:hypothetical protein
MFGAVLVALFAAILITSIVVRTQLNYPQAKVFFWFEAMWRVSAAFVRLAADGIASSWQVLVSSCAGPCQHISAYSAAAGVGESENHRLFFQRCRLEASSLVAARSAALCRTCARAQQVRQVPAHHDAHRWVLS